MRPTNHVLVPLLSQVGLMSDALLPPVSQARRKAPGGGAGALPFPAGVFFNSSAGVEAAEAVPWLELLSAAQTFSNASLAVEPQSYQVSFEWLDVLRASATKHSATWLHSLHMAVILIESGAVTEPLALLEESITLRPSAVAFRCLAVLQQTIVAARAYYVKVLILFPSVLPAALTTPPLCASRPGPTSVLPA